MDKLSQKTEDCKKAVDYHDEKLNACHRIASQMIKLQADINSFRASEHIDQNIYEELSGNISDMIERVDEKEEEYRDALKESKKMTSCIRFRDGLPMEEEDYEYVRAYIDETLMDNEQDIRAMLTDCDAININFVKKDGSLRNMLATLNNEYIPEDKKPKAKDGKEDNNKEDNNPDLITVFDMDAQGWRSFYASRVVYYTPVWFKD